MSAFGDHLADVSSLRAAAFVVANLFIAARESASGVRERRSIRQQQSFCMPLRLGKTPSSPRLASSGLALSAKLTFSAHEARWGH